MEKIEWPAFVIEELEATLASEPEKVDGLDLLGRGYPGWGPVADGGQFKDRVLDVSAIGAAEVIARSKGSSYVVTGADIWDYQSKLQLQVAASANVALFSGDFTASFSVTESQKSSRHFAQSFDLMTYYQLVIANPAVTPAAAAAFDTLSADDIVERFGTHVMVNIGMGASVRMASSVESSELAADQDFSVVVKAAYGEMVRGEASTSGSTSAAHVSTRTNALVEAAGGRPDLTPAIGHGDGGALEAWVASVASQPKELVEFVPDSLAPISQFCPEARRQEIDEAVERRLLAEWAAAVGDRPAPPPQRQPVLRNAPFRLKHEHGLMLSSCHWPGRGYAYGQLRPKAQAHHFGATGADAVRDGYTVELFSSELVGGRQRPRRYLGTFSNDGSCYYWSADGDTTSWTISIAPHLPKDVCYGDLISLKSVQSGNYLQPGHDGFLTTGPTRHSWRILAPAT